jgi:hypothetical protein
MMRRASLFRTYWRRRQLSRRSCRSTSVTDERPAPTTPEGALVTAQHFGDRGSLRQLEELPAKFIPLTAPVPTLGAQPHRRPKTA